MTVLINSRIRHLVNETQLIVGFVEECLEAASYDMRLGFQYVKSGRIRSLTDESPTMILNPGEFAILSSLEQINMPLNLVGHNGIPSKWAKRGLVSQFSPQIDPGFSGILTVPVFNAGDSPISLTRGDKIFTVEFVLTSESVESGWSDANGVQNALDALDTPYASRPNLTDVSELKERVEALRLRIDEAHSATTSQMLNLENTVTSRFAELTSDYTVFKGRLETVLLADERKQRSWTLLIAVATLLLGLLAGPWFASKWYPSELNATSTPAPTESPDLLTRPNSLPAITSESP